MWWGGGGGVDGGEKNNEEGVYGECVVGETSVSDFDSVNHRGSLQDPRKRGVGGSKRETERGDTVGLTRRKNPKSN